MRKDRSAPVGAVTPLWLESRALQANLTGEETRRRIDLYLPNGHTGAGLPLLVDLVGFTAGGPAHTNWKNHGESLPERLDRLIHSGAMPPVAVAFPDCFTRLGGNQYVDTPVLGAWEQFLIAEMLPFLEDQFGCGGPGKRGVFGKSSGGYGAIYHALKHGGSVWSAAACHSGDMGFELMYRHEFPAVLRTLSKYGGSISAFLEHFHTTLKTRDEDWMTIMLLAQAASFDPDPAAPWGVRLPVDPYTCELIPERWANWLAYDPLTLAPKHLANLRALKCLFIDCGDVDQYNLLYGARRMHQFLTANAVPHAYQEFPDNHSGIDYRMDVSLPVLAKALVG